MAEGIIIRRGIAPEEVVEYITATGGTTLEYNEGGKRYKSHTFTSSGNFVVSSLGSTPELNQVDYLIIAGGGKGGTRASNPNSGAGGGGAGGYRTTNGTSGGNSTAESKITVTAQSYGITIGAGGTGFTINSQNGRNGQGLPGSNTSALGITSIGGGGGAEHSGADPEPSANGGSGGGGNRSSSIGGSGVAGQGTNGGGGDQVTNNVGGGGGGAGQAGIKGVVGKAGDGGNGLSNTLRTGLAETRAGGGGGGHGNAGDSPGIGGDGGGGTAFGGNGAANTGSGGAAGPNTSSGNGGSGIVIIRYEIAPSA